MSENETMLRRLRNLAVALAAGISLQASTPPGDQLDHADWQEAVSEGSLAAYERYLELHPVGRHAAEAFRLAVLVQERASSDAASPLRPSYRSPWQMLQERFLSSLINSPAQAQDSSGANEEQRDWQLSLQENSIDSYTWSWNDIQTANMHPSHRPVLLIRRYVVAFALLRKPTESTFYFFNKCQ